MRGWVLWDHDYGKLISNEDDSRFTLFDQFREVFGWGLENQYYGEDREIFFVKDRWGELSNMTGEKPEDTAYYISQEAFLKAMIHLPTDTEWRELLRIEGQFCLGINPWPNHLVGNESWFNSVKRSLEQPGPGPSGKIVSAQTKEPAILPKQESLTFADLKTIPVPEKDFEDFSVYGIGRLGKTYLKETKIQPDGRQLSLFEKQVGNQKIRYHYLGEKGELPFYGSFTQGVLFATLGSVWIQGTASPNIPRADIKTMIGRGNIDRAYDSLFNSSIEIENDEKGKKYYRRLTRPIIDVEFFGKGRGSSVRPTIHPQVAQRYAQLGQSGQQYRQIPRDLLASDHDIYTRNYLFYLLGLRGHKTVYAIRVETLLKEKVKIPASKIDTMASSQIYDLVRRLCGSAEEKGLLREWKLNAGKDRTAKKWRLWKVEQVLSHERKQQFKGEMFSQDLSKQADYITQIVDWIHSFRKVKNPPEKTWSELEKVTNKIGICTLWETFQASKETAIHPGEFWTALKRKTNEQ